MLEVYSKQQKSQQKPKRQCTKAPTLASELLDFAALVVNSASGTTDSVEECDVSVDTPVIVVVVMLDPMV